MANNNFKAFAAAAGANVMTQSDYETLAALLTGFVSGTAQSAQLNKVWRQSSIMSAVLAQFIVDLTGQDAVDDGTTATLVANLKMAVQAQSAAVVGQARNVAMSVTSASASATLTADEIVVATALGGQKYVLKQFSKTINLATAGAGGMDSGSAPVSGFVALYAIYNPATGASALLASNATSAIATNVYGGANMPAGYTTSALVSVWPTNGSGQFIQAFQRDRRLDFQRTTAASSANQVNGLTAVNISSIIPKNALSCSGWMQVTCHASSSTQPAYNAATSVASDSTGLGYQQFATANPSTNVYTYVGMFRDVPITTPQIIYWSSSIGGGAFDSGNFQISGYSF